MNVDVELEALQWLHLAGVLSLSMPELGLLHQRFPRVHDAVAALRGDRGNYSDVISSRRLGAAGRALGRAPVPESAGRWPKGVEVTRVGDPAYPRALRPVAAWPPVLTHVGRLDHAPAVAVVGTRKASPRGLAFATDLGRRLAAGGVTVVSGLAMGIDAAAHRGCVESGGRGVAVVAGGLSHVGPRCNLGLARSLLSAGGCLVSHLPPDVVPEPWRFPVRNRLIAGLADVVVVVEADVDGGALSTARHAREMDAPRAVMAVPGFPGDRRCAGTNALLRDGALVCGGPDDVAEVLGVELRSKVPKGPASMSAGAAEVLDAVPFSPVTLDEVTSLTGRPAPEVLRALTSLELEGLVAFVTPATVQRVRGGGRQM